MANKYYDLLVHILDPTQHLLEKTGQDRGNQGQVQSPLMLITSRLRVQGQSRAERSPGGD